jgi:Uncharacterized protein conserved in bacteria (DUF2252)
MAKKAHKHPAIVAITIDYERWLRERVNVVEEDLDDKHRQMTSSLFAFLRATFYRWGPLCLQVCSDLADAPRLLAVGDLHVENFGTWRDKEGRLVWGVNDFDEVAEMPYTLDLVRLVTSAILAKHENKLAIDASSIAAAVLDGYAEALKEGGKPFILEESHSGLREMALGAERDPVHFWSKLTNENPLTPPKHIQKLLHRSLPDRADKVAYFHRIAGVGSLGRPRYVATACCEGGLVAREAKAWLPSAWGWAKGRPKDRAFSLRLLKHSVRQPDPYYTVEDGWVIRRIGPHCGRIELADCPKRRNERLILRDMGRETANLHLATSDRRENVLHDLSERKTDWLLNAAQAMTKATEQDWESFRSSPLANSQRRAKAKSAGNNPAPSC